MLSGSKAVPKCCLAVHLDLSREPKKTHFLIYSLKKVLSKDFSTRVTRTPPRRYRQTKKRVRTKFAPNLHQSHVLQGFARILL